MIVRRGPAIVLSLVLSAAALATAPGAVAGDGGPAKDIGPGVAADFQFTEPLKEIESCDKGAKVKLRVDTDTDGSLIAAGSVWTDDQQVWDWRFKHNEDMSAKGDIQAKDADPSFKVVRAMINYSGPDLVVFRAENAVSGEVCRAELWY